MAPSNFLVILAVVVLTTGIFLLDLVFLPLGISVGPLYAIPVLMSLWWPGRPPTTMSALGATGFVVLDFFLSPSGGTLWMVLLNRTFALFAIWSTALVVLYRKRADDQIKILSGLLSICASCKKIRDEENHWKPLEDYIHHHSEAAFSHSLCPQCLEEYQVLLKQRHADAPV